MCGAFLFTLHTVYSEREFLRKHLDSQTKGRWAICLKTHLRKEVKMGVRDKVKHLSGSGKM